MGIIFFCILVRKIISPLFFGSFFTPPLNNKDDIFLLGLPEKYLPDFSMLLLMFCHELCHIASKHEELMSFATYFWEGEWRGLESSSATAWQLYFSLLSLLQHEKSFLPEAK